MGKSSLGAIAKGYVDTLHGGSSDGIRPKDIAAHVIAPVAIGVAAFLSPQIDLSGIRAMFGNCIVAVSIVSALLCGAAVMVFQLRMQLSHGECADRTTRVERKLIDELFSDILWAVVCGFASVLLMVVLGTGERSSLLGDLLTAASLALLANYVMVTCMCIKRLNAAYMIVSKAWPNPSKRRPQGDDPTT